MGILDDDATVMKKTEEYVDDEMIHLYLKNQLPPHLANELVNNLIEAFMTDYSVDKRNASYDFCYLYFQRNKGHLAGQNIEYSCMHLWSYLASWGMLRGSCPLFLRSPAALKPLILYFDELYNSPIWNIDVDSYSEKNKEEILSVYAGIAQILEKITPKHTPSITLVTKIMLGVFGCVPAVDHFFYKTFHSIYGGFGVLGEKELGNIEILYQRHQIVLDSLYIPIMDFEGNSTIYSYKKAKLIDMFGFMVGKHVKP